MNKICGTCKYSDEIKPAGQKPAPGTVWCYHRNIQMAKNRQMPCFASISGIKSSPCMECRRARVTKPSGEATQIGNIWCDKKRFEINKQRHMGCFEENKD